VQRDAVNGEERVATAKPRAVRGAAWHHLLHQEARSRAAKHLGPQAVTALRVAVRGDNRGEGA
jgi:hypothetical protein